MAKKPTLAYGVARRPYSREFELFEITKESPASRVVYGRGEDGEATSRSGRDVKGRFATREEAEAAIEAVRTVGRHHDPIVKAAQDAYAAAERKRRDALDTALGKLSISGMNHKQPVQP